MASSSFPISKTILSSSTKAYNWSCERAGARMLSIRCFFCSSSERSHSDDSTTSSACTQADKRQKTKDKRQIFVPTCRDGILNLQTIRKRKVAADVRVSIIRFYISHTSPSALYPAESISLLCLDQTDSS